MLAVILGLCAGCGPKTDGADNRPPFVERIQPADYAAAELAFQEPLSRSYDLVFLRTDFGKPVSALALHPQPNGGYTLFFGAMDPNGQWQTVTSELDGQVGQQVLRAVELKLHRRVTVNGQRHDIAKNDGDLWIHQRLSDGRVATALISFLATVGNPEAKVFVDEFLGGLQQLVHLDPEQQSQVLTRLDQIATAIILAETPS